MSILSWIEDPKRLKLLNAPKHVNAAADSSKGLWTRCDKCGVILYIKHLKENQRVCFGCSYHLQMTSQERVENLLDKMSWRPLDETVSPCNPLGFHDQKDYTDRLQEAQERTGLQDAIQTGSGMIDGIPVALGVMDFDFMGGSMGSVVGEKVTRLIEYATQEGLTLILVCASGGARMQEGVFSLMQMAKISSALQVYQTCAKLLYISILTSPTTGGVTASFAMLGDIIFAEPKALIAFAGRRVIEQTLCEDLPDDFQTSEYMLHHGLLDLIVPRRFLRQALSESIRLYRNAPFKKTGRINFGVQNPISFLVEEKIRRQADKKWSTSSQNNFFNNNSQIDGLDQIEETSSISSKNRSNHKEHADPYNTSFKKEKVEIDSLSRNHADSVAGLPSTTRNAQGKETQFEEVFDIQTKNMLTKHKFAGVSLQTNETSNYREILTSFETMFHLFSKKLIVSYAQNTNSVSKENQEKTYLSQAKNIEGNGVKYTTSHNSSDLLLQDFMNFSKNQDDAVGLDQIESLEKDSKNPIYVDFLNKSIELAATESVEWRAFYVDQRIAPKACFLEDYVQSITAKTETLPVQQQKNDLTALQNILFYRSISRNLQ